MTPPRAVVLVTGSELVRGDRRDLNGPFLAQELTRLGLEPERVVVVGDRPDKLAAALGDGLLADLCILSGGLGPTHDDRTVALLAVATGRRLTVDETLAGEIEAFSRGVAERLGRPFADFVTGIRKQASLPDGGVSLGLAGTAPAVLLEHENGRVAIALPGPPRELRRLWPNAVAHPAVQRILARADVPMRSSLRFFGPSESAVARVLAEAGGERESAHATVCARDLEIHVDFLTAPGGEEDAARLSQALEDAFPNDLFARDDERPVEELVLEACRERGLTLATAESCTGGLVGARLTDVAGASDVFLGGVIAYANEVKQSRLGVPAAVLREHGAVSAETAAAMAAGARAELGADVGIADTGIAGPSGGSTEKPVGLVYIAVAGPAGNRVERFRLPGDREAVRARATVLALHMLRRVLTQSATDSRESDR
ncbi:MAG TPA: CinA family nicotinamide mononucleotide deamidase-related protein [Gaiellaceae bacterium]|nr:CinA family nicotinamide mononucleotide deamidase-related protein [Gaiellaceae bacterium]